jgi:hypothetical protein
MSYEDAYGLTGDELKTTVYYKLLKEKVSEKVVTTKSGKYIYARFGTAGGVEEIAGVSTENLDSWAKARTDEWFKRLESGEKFIDLYNEVVADNKYPASYATEFIEGANSQSSEAEKEAINKLQVGHFSKITKLDGFYAIFYLEENSGGSYKSWDAFIEDYTNKYVKYSLISAKTQNQLVFNFNIIKRLANEFLNIGVAEAACNLCSGCNGYYIQGTVTDSVTGYAIGGVELGGVSASSSFCDGSSSSSKTGWCGYRDGYASTNTSGYYIIPRWDGSSCRFNCAGGSVTLTAAKANYTAQVVSVSGTNGSGLTRNFALVPQNRTINVRVYPANAGSVTGTGINCGTSGSDCSETWAFSTANTNLTASPASGYVFDYFRIYPNYTTPYLDTTANPYSVYHGGNYTIDAVFKTSIPTTLFVTLEANPNSGNAPLNGVKLTATVTGTATGDVEYEFDCFNDGRDIIVQTNNNTLSSCNYRDIGVYTAGVKVWRAGKSATATTDVNVTGTPAVSCTVSPQTGLSPLVVKVQSILTYVDGGTFDYDMNADGVFEYTGRPSTVYYTYSDPGTYTIKVRHSTGIEATCSPGSIAVTNPDNGSGGEVAP